MSAERARALAGQRERQEVELDSPWWTVHLARYRFATRHAAGSRVLDVACGTGYGVVQLGSTARSVVGVDVDPGAAKTTRSLLVGSHTTVIAGDGRRLPFTDRSFTLVVSFETIEHLEQRSRFVAELSRVLAPDGMVILSTPNANHTRPVNGKPRNPFHVHEYRPEELKSELERHFSTVTLLSQVLDPRFRISPFWDEQEQLAAAGHRGRVSLWRCLRRLPRPLADWASHLLWSHPLFPSEEDYRFDDRFIAAAPVLVALCRMPK